MNCILIHNIHKYIVIFYTSSWRIKIFFFKKYKILGRSWCLLFQYCTMHEHFFFFIRGSKWFLHKLKHQWKCFKKSKTKVTNIYTHKILMVSYNTKNNLSKIANIVVDINFKVLKLQTFECVPFLIQKSFIVQSY